MCGVDIIAHDLAIPQEGGGEGRYSGWHIGIDDAISFVLDLCDIVGVNVECRHGAHVMIHYLLEHQATLIVRHLDSLAEIDIGVIDHHPHRIGAGSIHDVQTASL